MAVDLRRLDPSSIFMAPPDNRDFSDVIRELADAEQQQAAEYENASLRNGRDGAGGTDGRG
jgi:hypothetical protein